MNAITLFHRPQPQSGESLPGYLSRLTIHNYIPTTGHLGRIAEMIEDPEALKGVMRDLARGDVDLERLSSLTGAHLSDLKALMVTDLGAVEDGPGSSLRAGHWRICPLCLKEAGYHQSFWLHAWATACPTHHVRLIEACPSCNAPLSIVRPLLPSCLHCGRDLFVKTRAAGKNELKLSDAISHRHTLDHAPGSLSMYELLGSLNLLMRLTHIEFIPGRARVSAQRQDVNAVAKWAEAAWPLLSDEKSRRTLWQQTLSSMAARWPRSGAKAWLARAQRELRESGLAPAVAWLAEIAQLSSVPLRQEETPLDLEEYPLPILDAAEVLTISDHNVERLMQNSFLQRYEFDKIEDDQRFVSLSSIESLLAQIEAHVNQGAPKDARLTLPDSAQSAIAGGSAGLPAILQRVLDGSLRIYGNAIGGLSSFQIAATDLQSCFRTSTASPSEMSVKDAALYLGIYTDAVYKLIKVGKLMAHDCGEGRAFNKYLHRDDVVQFHEDYVFVSELAKTLKTNPTNLTERIRSLGPQPVAGPTIDQSLVYIFKRTDMQGLNLNAVHRSTRYATRVGRPKKGAESSRPTHGLITSVVASQALGISIQKLSLLVRSGLLQEHPLSRAAGNRRYFTSEALQDYVLRYRKNSALESIESAAEKLNSNVRRLRSTWVKSGLMVPINDGLGQWYVKRSETQKCVDLAKRYCFIGCLVERLGTQRHLIQNRLRLGTIPADAVIPIGNWFLYDFEAVKRIIRP